MLTPPQMAMSPSKEDEFAGPVDPSRADPEDARYAVALLAELTAIARKNRARQAETSEALRNAYLPPDPPREQAALRLLEAEGCIRNLTPLADGGLLVTVTATKPRRLQRRLRDSGDETP